MLFRVRHLTHYHYSKPVYLEPQTFRLRPREEAALRLESYSLEIEPSPATLTWALDANGNNVAHAWFDDVSESLRIESRFSARTLRKNPFDFLFLNPADLSLPVDYDTDLRRALQPCLEISAAQDGLVGAYAREVAKEASEATLAFLDLLNRRMCEEFEVEVRERGEPYPPEQTLAGHRGACRDLALLFMECCRVMGLAARFVSGYQDLGGEAGPRYLHAWAEVYLPGGGWRGYDPTHGLAVSEGHAAVAAAPWPEAAAPSSGSFRGTGAVSTMESTVEIDISGE